MALPRPRPRLGLLGCLLLLGLAVSSVWAHQPLADRLAAVTERLARDPGNPELHLALAHLLEEAGRFEEAAREILAAVRLPAREDPGSLASPTALQVLVPKLSTWAFDTTGADLGTAWVDSTYDDAAWPSGPGILGYGEPYIATTVPFGPNALMKYPTQYVRTTFTFPESPSRVTSLLLGVNRDDGFALYVNGNEVARQSLAPGAAYGTYAADHEGGFYETIALTAYAPLLVQGVNTLAAEVHQASAASSDLVWDLELAYSADTPELLRGPYLQVATSTSIIIRWRTDIPIGSRVTYGTNPGSLTGTAQYATPRTEHEMPLSGLVPATVYYYTVGTPDSVLAGDPTPLSFRTAPLPGSNVHVRLWALGDGGTANVSAAAVRDGYLSYVGADPADVWLMLGDNAYPLGTDAEYQAAVFDMYPQILGGLALWTTRGNHDLVHPGPLDDYYEIFTLPDSGEAGGVPSYSEAYYSFDHANVHVICLDSEGTSRAPGSPMLNWLALDLAATSQDWTLAFWHHPPYSKGSHDSDSTTDSEHKLIDMRENVLPLLDAAGVDLVLSGHSHSYERSFLLDGHYGFSWTLDDSMIVDDGDGRLSGDGAYGKATLGPGPHEGAVHVVAGSGGLISGGPLNHPVMVTSLNVLGSLIVDIDGNQLDGVFVDDTGAERDRFTIVKGGQGAVPAPDGRLSPILLPAYPNPARGSVRLEFRLTEAGPVRLDLIDVAGRHVRSLVDAEFPAGVSRVVWDGVDERGAEVPAGVYFAVFRLKSDTWTRKIIIRR